MNTKSIVLAVSVLVMTASCKKELEPQETSSTVDSTAVAAQATAQAPAVQAQPTKVEPVQQTVQPAQVAKGMNPAHGQPGHRCDIPVGASLSSPPAKPATPTATPTQTATRIVPQNQQPQTPAILSAPGAAQTTAPGMNPPHGQDGHRCDVAVGAPLPKS